MTTRTDVIVEYSSSPRVAEVAAPSTEFVMQDVVDTLRVAEEDFQATSYDRLLTASGKEALGGGVVVGITVALENALIAFEGRTTAAETGTVTTGSGTPTGKPLIYTFEDTAADFVAAGVARGSLVVNFTDQSVADVFQVVNSTTLQTRILVNGIGNTWDVADVYHVFNVVQVRATGGNLTALDDNGDPVPSGVLPTAFTQVLITSSSSATLQELTEIRYTVFQDAVWYDAINGVPGTAYPAGTPLQPVDNFPDARTIADALGFKQIKIVGNATLDTGDDVSDLTLIGENTQLTTITLNPGANVLQTQFTRATITGTLDGDSVIRQATILPPLNFVEGTILECLIEGGTLTLGGTSDVNILDCWSGVAGIATPIIDYNGSGRDLLMRRYSGGIEIQNKTGADSVSVDLSSGQVVLASSVTAGTLVLRGVGNLTHTQSGTEVVDSTGLISNAATAVAVWNELLSSHQVSGSFGGQVGDALGSYASVVFDDATNLITMNVWANGLASPTSCQLDWYNQDGSLLFTATNATPDAQGHFLLTKTQVLTTNRAYYGIIAVTNGPDVVTSKRGLPLVGP